MSDALAAEAAAEWAGRVIVAMSLDHLSSTEATSNVRQYHISTVEAVMTVWPLMAWLGCYRFIISLHDTP